MCRRPSLSEVHARTSTSKSEVVIPTDTEPPVRRRLLYFHEIPIWQQENEYIASGYRPISGSLRLSYRSLFDLHNQTINVFSHLIGALAFCLLPFHFYGKNIKQEPNALPGDLLVITIYCLGVTTCFAFSATFHITRNHIHSVTALWNKLDYLGVLTLMWGAAVPTIYFGFQCNHSLRLVYWLMTSAIATCCLVVTLHPRFIKPEFRKWRASFYAGFGLSSLVFIVHGIIVIGWEAQKARMSLAWMSWMALVNLTGAAVYAARIPERWAPYRFDIFGSSHQIFHVAALVAAVIHFDGLTTAFRVVRSRIDVCQELDL